MAQRVVETILLGLIMATSLTSWRVYCDVDFYGHAEPSHHVMHIRKLSDSDNLKIELEPVWFHLESIEQKAAEKSQQMLRQAKQTTQRPLKIFSNLKQLERHRRKNHINSQPNAPKSETTESFLKDFWQIEKPVDRERSTEHEMQLEQEIENIDLPHCFRQYLRELHDRNNESFRKLMRCLALHPENSCNEALRAHHRGSSDEIGEGRRIVEHDDPQQVLYQRKTIRKRKYSEHSHESSAVSEEREGLKFEKHFIRSDGDDEGQVFTAVDDSENSEDVSDETSQQAEAKDRDDAHNENVESDESERMKQKYNPRVPYRRPPPKYNTKKRLRGSQESKQTSSDEECIGCCENC